MFPIACVPRSGRARAYGRVIGNLVGDGEPSWPAGNGVSNTTQYAGRFLAVPGLIQDLRLKVSGSTKAKMAIYSNGASVPVSLVAHTSEVSCTSGWNTLSLVDPTELLGTYYWLTIKPETSAKVYFVPSGGLCKIATVVYADDFPATWPEGSTGSNVNLAVSGFGML